MKNILTLLVAISTLAVFPACGGKRVIQVHDTAEPQDGVVSVHFSSIVVKGHKYNANFVVSNRTASPVIFYATDMHCFRGSVEGAVKYEYFGIGHRTFKAQPGESHPYTMICDFQEAVEGDFRFTIARIYENPSGDGKTQGKLLSSDVGSTQAQGAQ